MNPRFFSPKSLIWPQGAARLERTPPTTLLPCNKHNAVGHAEFNGFTNPGPLRSGGMGKGICASPASQACAFIFHTPQRRGLGTISWKREPSRQCLGGSYAIRNRNDRPDTPAWQSVWCNIDIEQLTIDEMPSLKSFWPIRIKCQAHRRRRVEKGSTMMMASLMGDISVFSTTYARGTQRAACHRAAPCRTLFAKSCCSLEGSGWLDCETGHIGRAIACKQKSRRMQRTQTAKAPPVAQQTRGQRWRTAKRCTLCIRRIVEGADGIAIWSASAGWWQGRSAAAQPIKRSDQHRSFDNGAPSHVSGTRQHGSKKAAAKRTSTKRPEHLKHARKSRVSDSRTTDRPPVYKRVECADMSSPRHPASN
ncbi:hypothetical protein FQR65_LT19511 [Abscondita terminalis]|nr:hypothetical protein FQR65_LT19511 [Abscondita terminalis]